MSTLAVRKHIELSRKVASLKDDFREWTALTAGEQGILRLHKSQIAKVTGTLAGPVSALEKSLAQGPPPDADAGDAFLKEARNTEQMILATHSVWAFFRKKLAQRLEPGFSRFLDAADELAWSCCKPALEAANRAPKEPPLVFLNGALSPFMVARDNAFIPEDVPPQFLGLAEFKEIVSRLPIPVIGLPWAQIGHLPDTLSVAHEAGHVVEDELSLEDELKAAIGRVVPQAEQEIWLRWRAEIFADLWACAALGPSYVSALCDFLSGDPMRDAAEKGQSEKYPGANLRVTLLLKALHMAGFHGANEGPVASLQGLWPMDTDPAFDASGTAVVEAMLRTRLAGLGNHSVHDIFKFGPQDFFTARSAFDALQRASANLGTTSVRLVFAGVRQGYDADPVLWHDRKIPERLLARFDRKTPRNSLLPGGFRSVTVEAKPKDTAELAQELLANLRRLIPTPARGESRR